MAHKASIIVLGGAHMDLLGLTDGDAAGTSVAGAVTRQAGGVAFNISRDLSLLGAEPFLISAVGDDDDGRTVQAELDRLGIEHALLIEPDFPTGTYLALVHRCGTLLGA
ncbi:MAG: PfkB family carbohydrate kinase, partial [Pseudomonadota bacterium]